MVLVAGCYKQAPPPENEYIPRKHAQALNRQAVEALHAGQLDAALRFEEEALADDGQFYEAHCNRAAILAKQGRFGKAAEGLAKAAALRPELAEPHVFRGVYLEKAGDQDGARGAFARATALYDQQIAGGDESPATAVNRAVAMYLHRGKVSGITALNEVIARFPAYPRALFLRQRILEGDRDYFTWWASHPEEHDASEAAPAQNAS